MTELSLAISPCPNDTFIFDSFLNRCSIKEVCINASFHDIETLNQGAQECRWDIVKVSCAILDKLPQYTLLPSGGAMGEGVGPLIIAKDKMTSIKPKMTIGIPGFNTTAYKLFRFFYKSLDLNIKEINFADIERAVFLNQIDAGLIIHESRFTYSEKKLFAVVDLGALWQQETKLPVPLGCIMVNNKIFEQFGEAINIEIQNSLRKSWDAYPQISDFVKQHAQTMQEEVMRAHIELYVNEFSLDMRTIGREAISALNA